MNDLYSLIQPWIIGIAVSSLLRFGITLESIMWCVITGKIFLHNDWCSFAKLWTQTVTYPSTLLTFSYVIFLSLFFFFFSSSFFLDSQLACVFLTASSCSTLLGHVSVTLNSVTLSYLKYVKCIRWSLAHNETRVMVLEP